MRRLGTWATRIAVVTLAGCGRTSPDYPDDPQGDEIESICARDPDDPSACSSVVTLERAADILFVIDDSGSMGEEQGKLAANFAAFIDVLEDQQVGASYRIGVVGTDARPGYWAGLRATSCRERIQEFERSVRLGQPPVSYQVDSQQAGCLDACRLPTFRTEPTTTARDAVPRPRPWLQKSDGATNLPPGVDMADAFQCVGPQGIDGYGFEQPLESMRRVLTEDVQGFVRDDALLAIIFVTDEIDCSASAENIDRMQRDQSRALWTDPTRDGATSGVCWRAAVECTGGPGIYDDCFPRDFDFSRQPTTPENAVVYPVQRYIDVLRDVSNEKQRRFGNGTVLVAVISGVPEDYPEGGELVFRDSDSRDFTLEYGIGPSCGRGTETMPDPPGLPPVRLREFAEAFETNGRNIFSICADDYTVALEQIAGAIAELGTHSCVPGCVADTSPNVSGLQPRCSVIEKRGPNNGGERRVEPCSLDDDGWWFPSDESEICYRELSDDGETPPIHDDISQQCLTRGSNLEIAIERRVGVPVTAGSAVQVDCELVDLTLGRTSSRCEPS